MSSLLKFLSEKSSLDPGNKSQSANQIFPKILAPALEICLFIGEYSNLTTDTYQGNLIKQILQKDSVLMTILNLYLKAASIELDQMDMDQEHDSDDDENDDSDDDDPSTNPSNGQINDIPKISAFHLSTALNNLQESNQVHQPKSKQRIAQKAKQVLYTMFPRELRIKIQQAHSESDVLRSFGGMDIMAAHSRKTASDQALMDLINGMEMLSPIKNSGQVDSAVDLRRKSTGSFS